MSNVLVGQLTEWIVGWFQSRRKQRGRNLPEMLLRPRREMAERAACLRQPSPRNMGCCRITGKIIREMRDTQG